MRVFWCGFLMVLLSGCSVVSLSGKAGSTTYQAGQIIKSSTGELISREQLALELAQESIVLLGEKHDNAEHHVAQLWLLQAMAEQREQGAIVFEMLTTDQQPLVERVKQQIHQGSWPENLASALEWNAGWEWEQYQALIEYALTSNAQVVSGNLTRAELMAIYRNPVQIRLGLAGAKDVREQLQQHIFEAHCEKLPESQIPSMLAVQQQRDRYMAQAILQSQHPVTLIAGAYHARNDMGVPLHLQDLQSRDSKTVIFVEEGQEYEQGIADYVWITEAVAEKDYCAELAQ